MTQSLTAPGGEPDLSVPAPDGRRVARRRRWRRITVVVVVLAVLAGGAFLLLQASSTGTDLDQLLTHQVRRADLVVSVTEGGTVESQRSEDLASEVEGRTTILYIVPEGQHVKKGQLLVQLDGASLRDQENQQGISFASAEAAYIEATENYEIQKNQNDSNVKAAKLDLEFGKLDMEKYLEGDWPQQKRKAESDIVIAEMERAQADDKLEWTRRLEKDGYVTRGELEKDRLALKKRELDLAQAKESLRLLMKFTHPKRVRELQSMYEEAEKNLQRVIRRARSQLAQAEATRQAKKATLGLQKAKLEKIRDQIRKTKIYAPQGGLVVYANQTNWRGQVTAEIEQGAEVRQRQKIISLPDVSSMQVKTKIHESQVDKVKAGRPCRVTVDAVPGHEYRGAVKSVAILADSSWNWRNPDVKQYVTIVKIDGETRLLKPGMTAEVEILVTRRPQVLVVPMQAVRLYRAQTVCYVRTGDEIERREVTVGLNNDKLVEIERGLAEGQTVLLTIPKPQMQEEAMAYFTATKADRFNGAAARTQPTTTRPSATQASQPAVPGRDASSGAKHLTPAQRKAMRAARDRMSPDQRRKAQRRTKRGGRKRPQRNRKR